MSAFSKKNMIFCPLFPRKYAAKVVIYFEITKNITTFSTNSYQKCRLVVILRGNDSLTYTSKMRKFCNYFLILLYFLYSILVILYRAPTSTAS